MPPIRGFALFIVLLVSSDLAAQTNDATLPPASQHAVLSVEGRGAQVYRCQLDPVVARWVLQAPVARLFDANDREVGTHGDGPSWTLNDGSSMIGMRVAEAPAAADSIPALLLKAGRTRGAGALANVEYVRRSEPHGGIAPATGCDAAHLGELARVPYTAKYTFYSSQPAAPGKRSGE